VIAAQLFSSFWRYTAASTKVKLGSPAARWLTGVNLQAMLPACLLSSSFLSCERLVAVI